MGTNFYLIGHRCDDSPEYHIGKRSAVGLYCFDCRQTLCKDGEAGIHTGKSEWHDRCPQCGCTPIKETLDQGTSGLELGFAKPYKKNERAGVRSASSFTWAMNPYKLIGRRKVVDEYGRVYGIKKFKEQVLDNCPIQFFDSIGREFS